MGQYYKFINIDKKQRCDRNEGLLKLLEHSYLANEHCIDILSLLSNEWKGDRVIHVGDYAKGNDNTTTSKLIANIENENNLKTSVYGWSEKFIDIKPKSMNDKIRYVYNLEKKEYIDLFKQPVQWFCYDKNKIMFAKINSFALLISCGNEQGGGDYFGVNKKFVGYWAGDKLLSSESLLNEYSSFQERKTIFDENLYLNKRIKNNNQKTEKRILQCEGSELKKFFKYLTNQTQKEIDLKKLELDKNGLTDLEYIYLNSLFNKYKKRELTTSEVITHSEAEYERDI